MLFQFESADSIKDLTNEEICQLLPDLKQDEKIDLHRCLIENNSLLESKVLDLEKNIQEQKELNIILIRKIWNTLDEVNRKDLAIFFQEKEKEILN